MTLPPRILLPLASLGLVGFIALGAYAAGRANALGELGDVREQTLSVVAADGSELAVHLVEPSGSGDRSGAVLVGLPADGTRIDLARAIARRGWSVAVLELRGTEDAPGEVADRVAAWITDLSDVATWVTALPHVVGSNPALIALRAASPVALAAKGSGDRFSSLALVLPSVPPETSPIGAPAFRTTPSGVLVVGAVPFTLPDAVFGFLQEPRSVLTAVGPTLGAVTTDDQLLDRMDRWLRDPDGSA